MEIKKLDRDKAEEDVKKKAAFPHKEKGAPKKEKKQSPDDSQEKLSPGKAIGYAILMVVVAGASATYNYFAYQKAHEPLSSENQNSRESVSIDFYELCDDIEFYREENGEYPESIKDLTFSDGLKYIRTSEESFRLTYNDGKIRLDYDSTRDFDEIR